MATPKDLPQDIGAFIRDLRQTARISLRQLADRAGVIRFADVRAAGAALPGAAEIRAAVRALR